MIKPVKKLSAAEVIVIDDAMDDPALQQEIENVCASINTDPENCVVLINKLDTKPTGRAEIHLTIADEFLQRAVNLNWIVERKPGAQEQVLR